MIVTRLFVNIQPSSNSAMVYKCSGSLTTKFATCDKRSWSHTAKSTTLTPFLPWNVTLPRESPLTLPFRILRSALLQISKSLLPWLLNSLAKLFLCVGQRENSDWSFVMRFFPSLQTLSEYFLHLEFKSPIRRIEPLEENISMLFSSSSNNSKLKYGELNGGI